MSSQNISRTFQLAATVLAAGSALFGQIAQDKPELCGKSGFVPVPPNVMADSAYVESTLTVTPPGAATGVKTTLYARVEQVCPIAANKYLVFGHTSVNSYEIAIVDAKTGSVLDKFGAWDPSVSPDQHWLVYRAFYSPRSYEVPYSEEYLVYDLTEDTAGNTAPNPALYTERMRGRVIYPAVAEGRPFEHNGLPANQTHTSRSNSFYWSSDGAAVLFADSLGKELSLVLTILDSSGPRTLVHSVTPSEACEQGPDGNIPLAYLTLSEAELDAKQQRVQVRFASTDEEACRPKFLVLNWADFNPAAIEVHKPIVRTGIPIPVPRERIARPQ